ncbi:choice-of-anchor B family protein [Marivirga sp.]|uniref:choice-of-anchor B family protein n=1 Tax=Marivirga sp. TaxID=2018662 RepID=UPI002D7F92F0|nr:choice-of-anchor B family protein [Marivirga sp.]HET8861432.1 choice-of-anchor B family protein [Marivirga sp.]
MTRFLFSVSILSFVCFQVISQTPCENASAAGFPCNQIDMVAHLDNFDLAGEGGVEGNDIWGWTDPISGIEYVLMGQTNGVVFIDISEPSNPIIIGRMPSESGNSSPWRDVKVYENHAFVVADNNNGHGMQVFDLTRLRDATDSPITFESDAVYDGVSSAHNIVINEETGFAYIVGARGAANNCGQGGLHIVNIQDPKNPVFAGCFDVDGYTHDAQCVVYNGPDTDYQGKEICFNANENTITIANVDDKASTSLISKIGYPQSQYAHQGWLTEDQQYFISNDELDERNIGFNTRTLIWDVRDLDSPKLLTQYYAENASIDHNLYTKDNMIFQSNYTSGLVVLDGSRIAEGNLRELASFDTYPPNDNRGFDGSWSNYPYFESGIIGISDINSGLFLVQLNIKDVIITHPEIVSEAERVKISIKVDESFDIESYQWQQIQDGIYSDLTAGSIYSNVNTSELWIETNSEARETEVRFRCKVTLADGSVATSFTSDNLGEDFVLDADEKLKQYVSLYPNPVREKFQIEVDENSNITSIKVINLAGRTILEDSMSSISKRIINTIDWKAGMYFIIFKTTDGDTHLKKIIKN